MRGFTLLLTLCACLVALQQTKAPEQSAEFPVVEWTIGQEKRQAIVMPPSTPNKEGAPVVFVFHGHGGNMYRMARLGFQKHWKEAWIVCPQGLPTVSGRDPEGKFPGWQTRAGEYSDRDLKFYDAILKTLREQHRVDARRVYATGHSNGGFFTYLLWAERGDVLRAIAPSACHANNIRSSLSRLRPIPVMHLAGERDVTIPFHRQQQSMDAIKRVLQCESTGRSWAKAGSLSGTLYPSSKGAPFVAVVHSGGHKYPQEAPELIVRFFKELGGGTDSQKLGATRTSDKSFTQNIVRLGQHGRYDGVPAVVFLLCGAACTRLGDAVVPCYVILCRKRLQLPSAKAVPIQTKPA